MKARESLAARLRSENGAVLVYVAVAMIGLVAFSALSVDYGVMWSSRRQAQNAADAAAHAGAVSLAFDSPTDFERARAVAETVGETNTVFGGTLNIDRGAGQGDNADPALDISFPHDGAAAECPTPLTGGTCVRANVYRNEGNNPLPTFFGHIFGRTEQGVRATATAQIVSGNASDCLKPWAVADRWTENVKRVCTNANQFPPCSGSWQPNQTWNISQTFDRYAKTGNVYGIDASITAAGQTPDEYILPSYDADGNPIVGTGSGFSLTNTDGTLRDYGQMLSLKISSGNTAVSPGWFQALDLSSIELLRRRREPVQVQHRELFGRDERDRRHDPCRDRRYVRANRTGRSDPYRQGSRCNVEPSDAEHRGKLRAWRLRRRNLPRRQSAHRPGRPVRRADVPRHKPDWHGWLSDDQKYLRVFHPDAGAGCHS